MDIHDPRRSGHPVSLGIALNPSILTVAHLHRVGDLHQIGSPDIANLRCPTGAAGCAERRPREECSQIPALALGGGIVHRTIGDDVGREPRDFPVVGAGASTDIRPIHCEIESDTQRVDLPFKVVVPVAIWLQEEFEHVVEIKLRIVFQLGHPEVVLGDFGVEVESAFRPSEPRTQFLRAATVFWPQDIDEVGEPRDASPLWCVRALVHIRVAGKLKAQNRRRLRSHQVQVTRGADG